MCKNSHDDVRSSLSMYRCMPCLIPDVLLACSHLESAVLCNMNRVKLKLVSMHVSAFVSHDDVEDEELYKSHSLRPNQLSQEAKAINFVEWKSGAWCRDKRRAKQWSVRS
jgi:hypothetical protein